MTDATSEKPKLDLSLNPFLIKPCKDYVMLRRYRYSETSAGGIVKPDSQRQYLPIGLVISKGPDCSDRVNLRSMVIFQTYAGLPIDTAEIRVASDIDERWSEVILIREDDIIAVMEEVQNG